MRIFISKFLVGGWLIASLTVIARSKETSDMSPFNDLRSAPIVVKMELEQLSDRDPITGERIVNLDPMIVRPLLTPRERVFRDAQKRRDQFLSEKTWAKEYRGLTGADRVLNLDFLPNLGFSKEQIAQMHGKDREFGKAIDLVDSIIENRKDQKNAYQGKDMDDIRFDLRRMKRNAIQLFPDSRN